MSKIGMLSGCIAKPKTSFHVGTGRSSRQHSSLVNMSFLCAVLSVAGCRGAEAPKGGPESHEREIWVALNGSDAASGELGLPVRTLKRALDSNANVIRVGKGRHEVGEIYFVKPVSVVGADSGRTVLAGRLFVDSDQVNLSQLDVQGGLSARKVQGLRLEDIRLSANAAPAALSLDNVQAELFACELTGGEQSGIETVSSTLTIHRSRLNATRSRRGIHQRGGVINVDELELKGASSAAIFASVGARLVGHRLRLSGEGGGISARRNARLELSGLEVDASRRVGIVMQGGSLNLKSSRLTGVEMPLGLQGTRATVSGSTISGGRAATVSLSSPGGSLSLNDVDLRHGLTDGVVVEAGSLTGQRVRFWGQSKAPGNGHALIGRGAAVTITLKDSTMTAPTGYGALLVDDVQAELQVHVRDAGKGGIRGENLWAQPLKIVNSTVEGCTKGEGVGVYDGSVDISGLIVTGCGDAGVLLGRKSRGTADKVSVRRVRRWGFAAFGGASLEITAAETKKTPFAVFASCATAAKVSVSLDSKLSGRVVACP